MKRFHLLPLLLWTLLWGLFFATLLLGIERLPNSDLSGQFHAFGSFQAREMLAGRLPLWSPGSYAGIPFAADTQSAVFYPLRWLTVFISAPFGFSYYALELEGLLHIWLAGVFTYFLAFDMTRVQLPIANRQLTISNWAALIAAVAFALGGYLISYPLLQLAVLETITWLPLVLLLVRRGVLNENSQNVRYLLAAGVVLGVSALAGHPQTFMHVSYLAAAYFLFLTWQVRWRWTAVLGLGLMVGAAAVGIAMAAFLPALRFVGQTVRSDVSYEFVAKGFSLLDYMQTFVPGPFSVWQSNYVGLTAVFLALLAITAAIRTPNTQHLAKREPLFWGMTVLLAAWLSLGDKGILYALAYRVLPGFSLFRQQERLVVWLSLGLALLAAQGMVYWWRADGRQRRFLLKRTGWVTAVLLLLFGFMLTMMRSAVGWSWMATWLRQIVFLLLTLLLLWPWTIHSLSGKRWQKAVPLLLILLLFIDLFLTARKPLNLQAESPGVFWPQPAWLDQLPRGEVARIDGQNLVHVNLGELFELEDIRGISPLKPEFSARFEKLPRPLRWQLLNVTHVLAPEQIEAELIEVARIEGALIPGEALDAAVYRFEDALPRAWMVYDPLLLPDETAAWQQLKQPEFNPAAQVILTTPLPAAVTAPEQPSTVSVTRDKPGTLRIEVDTQTPGVLVVSEWVLPGWKARLDGTAVPILTANTALQAVFMPAGSHTLELVYRPWEVWFGIGISLLTLVAAAVVAWRWQPNIPLHREGKKARRTAETGDIISVKALAQTWVRWLLVGVILLGFGLRVYRLGNQELRGDEAFSYLYTLLPLGEVVPELIDEGDPHSPFHYL
ncbi:MAG: hypothetical protein KDE48_17475, partial [Anaerolineales bacterium]|nr:hypothetical protein [Anaerolineales bacterium]